MIKSYIWLSICCVNQSHFHRGCVITRYVFRTEEVWVKGTTLQFQSRLWSHLSICCGNLPHFSINAPFPPCFLLESNSQREAFDFQTVLTISRKSDPFCGFAFPLGRGGGTHECLVNQTKLCIFHSNISTFNIGCVMLYKL